MIILLNHVIFKGNKNQRAGDMGLIQLTFNNNHIFNVSGLPENKFRTPLSKVYGLRNFRNRMTQQSWLARLELCILSFTFSPNHKNDHQQQPNFSSHILQTLCYKKFTCIPMTKKIHKTNMQILTATQRLWRSVVTVKSLYKLAFHKIPLADMFINFTYYIHTRNNLIHYI